MQIAAIQPFSLSDFPPYAAAIIFTIGCNLRCSFCHNKNLWDENHRPIDPSEVLALLEKRKNQLDGIVISGGEPTIQKELIPFAEQIKTLGYKIKLNTNGTRPDTIEQLIALQLVDYIAIDIKTDETKAVSTNIKKSISIISSNGIDHEFRIVWDKKLLTNQDLVAIKQESLPPTATLKIVTDSRA